MKFKTKCANSSLGERLFNIELPVLIKQIDEVQTAFGTEYHIEYDTELIAEHLRRDLIKNLKDLGRLSTESTSDLLPKVFKVVD